MTLSIDPKLSVKLKYRALSPFGLLLEATNSGSDIRDFSSAQLRQLIWEHHLIVLRGFSLLEPEVLSSYCATWGEIVGGNFGTILDLVVHDNPKNYLFTNGKVPFHWDGAFATAMPTFMFFQCLKAPPLGSGGETLFFDTTRVWEDANPLQREIWKKIEITYRTERVAHYGGEITVSLVNEHPITGKTTLRFAEPVDAGTYLNPLFFQIAGLPAEQHDRFLSELIATIYLPQNCYVHEWHEGDILIAENYALLHGRRPFELSSSRHLQRVNVISSEIHPSSEIHRGTYNA
ncbi:MAG: TauD/TfdA family dioxygenase [Prochloraceae cyanobacterium]|nr:TauD/TfdA family dioxygenase [Prochloraceae cyanobacterium]